jgi:hypothetical protein
MNKNLTVGLIATIMLAIIGITVATTMIFQQHSAASTFAGFELTNRKMTLVTPGNNTYIAWWTNQTGNDEVMFRASTDNGVTFSDKINLSNSTDADSQDAEVAVQDERNVIVTWYERNATSNEPVLRISNDNGQTFGGLLRLEADGTLSSWP